MNRTRTVLSAFVLTTAVLGFACSKEQCDALNGNPIGKVAVAVSEQVLAPGLTCAAYDTNPTQLQPGASPQSLMAPGGACAKEAGDDACIACTKAKCCGEAAAAASDSNSAAVIDCINEDKSHGGDGAACGTTPEIDAARACVKANCDAC
jgi:hypothetical protein